MRRDLHKSRGCARIENSSAPNHDARTCETGSAPSIDRYARQMLSPHPFSRYVLRTTDVASARSFYGAVLGHNADDVVALHPEAIARGARPHWLGSISVGSPQGVAEFRSRWAARGAQVLAAPEHNSLAVLRDSGGAIVAVTRVSEPSAAPVAFHLLNSLDADQSRAEYATLFGWSFEDEMDLGSLGRHRPFAYSAGQPSVGALSAVQGRPSVHPHWLFFFEVASLEAAIAATRALGGIALEPIEVDGRRMVACDDAQGAAFGLLEREPAVLWT
jgi:uncharacterized protein